MVEKAERQPDSRIRKTRMRLRRAYFEMVSRGEKISVASLAGAAGVTRGTFYQHYSDREEFERSVLEDTVSDFMDTAVYKRQGSDLPERMNLHVALEELNKPDNGFALLFQRDADEKFTTMLATRIAAAMRTFAHAEPIEHTKTDFKDDDLIRMAALIMVLIWRHWLLDERKRSLSYTEKLTREVTDAAALDQVDVRGFYY